MDVNANAVLSRLTFPWEERERLLGVVTELLDGGFSESEVYGMLAARGYSDEVKKVGRISLQGKDETGFFCGKWGEDMFPRLEAMLMMVGEKNGNIKEVVRVISEVRKGDLSFGGTVVRPLANLFSGFVMMGGMLMYFGGKRDLFAGLGRDNAVPQYVVAGEWLLEWWAFGVSGFLIGLLAYLISAVSLPRRVREIFYPTTLFVVRDRLFAIRVCGLLEALLRSGESGVGALSVMLNLSKKGYQQTVVQQALDRANGGQSLAHALTGTVMDESQGGLLIAVAPMGDTESLIRGIPMAKNMIREFTRSMLVRQKRIWMVVIGLPTGWFGWLMLPLFTGEGIY